MFGYVRPRTDLLTQADRETYHRAYCGLCRALGKGYGFAARFLVNYDMTFLYLLRAGLDPQAPSRRCWCPARVCGSKDCTLDPTGYEIPAACTVLLCVEKLRDDVRDKGFFRSLPHRLGLAVFRRAYQKAARRLPEFAALTRRQLDALAALEAAQSPSIDATADAFARIVAACAVGVEDPARRRPLEQILYQTGRFLYLADALDDLKEDCRTGAYNPLRFRFDPKDGALGEAELDYLTQLTDATVNLAGSALALLPLASHGALLENILYLGLPGVFRAVRLGKFQARAAFGREKRSKGAAPQATQSPTEEKNPHQKENDT